MDTDKVVEIYDYLIAPATNNPAKADGAFVFGRADKLIAEKVAELFGKDLIQWAMITGGIGKDSGCLTDIDLPEAAYQAALLRWKYGIADDKILVETKATNGAQNSRYGLDLIRKSGKPCQNIIIVAHTTSLRRLYAAHLKIAEELGFVANYQLASTSYQFNPQNARDKKEAIDELLRLADWPAKGWSVAQDDLRNELVEFARNSQ